MFLRVSTPFKPLVGRKFGLRLYTGRLSSMVLKLTRSSYTLICTKLNIVDNRAIKSSKKKIKMLLWMLLNKLTSEGRRTVMARVILTTAMCFTKWHLEGAQKISCIMFYVM